MSTTRLVILGILREQALHGYEIKHIIEENMGDWTSIAFGSIYFALNKLADEGFIEKVATEQEGNRPSRSIYQISKSGREEFLNLLRQVWQDVERQYFDIDVGIAYMNALPVEEIKGYLHERIAQLEGALVHIEAHQNEQMAREEVPRTAIAVFEHGLAHYRAELTWTRDLLEKVEAGIYP